MKKQYLKNISDGLLPKSVVKILDYVFIGVINGWSLVHMLSGMFFGLFLRNNWLALLIHTFWEVFQFTIGDNLFDVESLFDITFDTIFFMFGFWLINKIKY